MGEETTNQTPAETTESTSDDDFGQFLAEEPEETTESTEQHETTEPKQEEQPFLDIKYNGATEHLTKDQTVELAQKGRNYDKVYQRLQDIQNSPVLQTISEQANRAGLSLEEYANRLAEFQQTSDINKIAEDFKASHPDASDEIAQDYAQKAYEGQLAQQQQAQAQEAAQEQADMQSAAEEQVKAFMKEYPDVDLNKLPPEVINDIDNNGETLLNAYRAYDNRQLRAALQASRKNTENVKRGAGNLSANSGGTGEMEPFLQGLLGDE